MSTIFSTRSAGFIVCYPGCNPSRLSVRESPGDSRFVVEGIGRGTRVNVGGAIYDAILAEAYSINGASAASVGRETPEPESAQ